MDFIRVSTIDLIRSMMDKNFRSPPSFDFITRWVNNDSYGYEILYPCYSTYLSRFFVKTDLENNIIYLKTINGAIKVHNPNDVASIFGDIIVIDRGEEV